MPFEYCEFSGAACAKQEEQQDAPNEGMVQQPAHEKQLSDEFQEKAAISNAKRGAGKTVGAKPHPFASVLMMRHCGISDVLGDVEETVAAFLLKNFEIPEDKVVFLPEK
ncbi:translation initiation factor sui1 domain-containing protein [Cyclospora cayetanensis]|uniref:Translation initiation factor sui1 domain-containing protein n=1 Tax=Cyclospora cayetanensis TaxID=88456 RepID=A0A1D3D543_9EIME|nr:translation initiation factor sui1 domain-containing protein [Cyclospora cayetanensis]